MIELLGLPGCGKSTFVRQDPFCQKMYNPLQSILYSDSRMKQNLNKVYPFISFFLNHPRISRELLKLLLRIKFRNKKSKIKSIVYFYSVLGCIDAGIKKCGSSNIVLDEGIHQILWGILYVSYDSQKYIKDIWTIVYQIYEPVDIILLCTNKSIIIERLMKRHDKGGSELQHDIKNDPFAMEKAISDMEFICDLAKTKGVILKSVS